MAGFRGGCRGPGTWCWQAGHAAIGTHERSGRGARRRRVIGDGRQPAVRSEVAEFPRLATRSRSVDGARGPRWCWCRGVAAAATLSGEPGRPLPPFGSGRRGGGISTAGVVVPSALLRVQKHVACNVQRLHSLDASRIWVPVRMVLLGELAIGGIDDIGIGGRVHLEDLVVVRQRPPHRTNVSTGTVSRSGPAGSSPPEGDRHRPSCRIPPKLLLLSRPRCTVHVSTWRAGANRPIAAVSHWLCCAKHQARSCPRGTHL